jgi:hypothetical protein
MRRLVVLAALAFSAPVAAVAAYAGGHHSPPPGATARCRDGTYSYSAHRSGTCSHHGGVAEWLTSGGGRSGGSSTHVAVGRTVLLGARARSGGCLLGSLPDRRCSPGAYYSGLSSSTLCSVSFSTSSIRNVSEGERHAVEAEYGLAARSYGRALEVDHIVPLELGGSNDAANLFPEQAKPADGAGYHLKDKLENAVHRLVCQGTLPLRRAQREMAGNWEQLYKKVFGVSP